MRIFLSVLVGSLMIVVGGCEKPIETAIRRDPVVQPGEIRFVRKLTTLRSNGPLTLSQFWTPVAAANRYRVAVRNVETGRVVYRSTVRSASIDVPLVPEREQTLFDFEVTAETHGRVVATGVQRLTLIVGE